MRGSRTRWARATGGWGSSRATKSARLLSVAAGPYRLISAPWAVGVHPKPSKPVCCLFVVWPCCNERK